MKNDLPFFSHDNDAASHAKHKALRARYGWDGYGRFWALNEMIAREDGCRLDLKRPVIRASFANELGLSDSEMDDFLDFLADPDRCGLIHYDDGVVTTDRTQEDFERVSKKRHRGRSTKTVSENKETVSENAEIDSDLHTEQSRVEQNRKEQSRADARAREDAAAPCSASELLEELGRCIPNLRAPPVLIDQFLQIMTEKNLELDYVRFFARWIRRQPKLTARGYPGYFRVHFGEEEGEYRMLSIRDAVKAERRQAEEAELARANTPEGDAEIEAAKATLPWILSRSTQDARASPGVNEA